MLHPRARTMLILSVPAILIGIACSLILIVAMKVAALLQRVLWSNLPAQLGVSADSPLWIIAMLTATGIAVGLVIRYSPGHAGPDPATESLIGAPIATGALPGLLAALILGLAGGEEGSKEAIPQWRIVAAIEGLRKNQRGGNRGTEEGADGA